MTEEPSFTISSGNVFADLGVDEPEEALAKAALAYKISRIIDEKTLTLAQAARALGVDQPAILALVRGQLDDFTTDHLLRFLTALDHDVEIAVTPKGSSRVHGQIAIRDESGFLAPPQQKAPSAAGS